MRKLWIVLPVFVTASMASAAYGGGLVVAPVTKVNTAVVTQVPVGVVTQVQTPVAVAVLNSKANAIANAAVNNKVTATSGISFGSSPLIGH